MLCVETHYEQELKKIIFMSNKLLVEILKQLKSQLIKDCSHIYNFFISF